MRYYLSTPFSDKNYVKSLGAKWDPTEKHWYVLDKNSDLINKYPLNNEPINTIVDEDRSYNGNELFVDMIPTNSWAKNARELIHFSDWDRVRKFIYNRVNNICECCGYNSIKGKIEGDDRYSLEAHERWEYDEVCKVQKLKRLIALCHNCHMVTHFGYSCITGVSDQSCKHLMKVKKLSAEECEIHIDEAYKIWENRSKIQWTIDISILEKSGIKVNTCK